MEFELITEPKQEQLLQQFNQSTTNRRKIPNLLRNLKTGWPMLQIALFNPVLLADNSVAYEPAFGGGNCSFLHMPVFYLASMIQRSDTTAQSDPSNFEKTLTSGVNNMYYFMRHYKVDSTNYNIHIDEKPGMMGMKLTTINLPGHIPNQSQQIFQNNLESLFSLVVPINGNKITDFAAWGNEVTFTQEEIVNALDSNLATFHEGQIYVDFGAFLTQVVQAPSITHLFELVFKVDLFNREIKPFFQEETNCMQLN